MYSETPVVSTPPLTKINKVILLVTFAVFIVQTVAKLSGFPLTLWMSLYAPLFFTGHLYQLLVYPFTQQGLMEFLFNGLILWFIGSELEMLWGGPRYMRFLALASLVSGLLYVVLCFGLSVPVPLMGLSLTCFLLLTSYSVLFPDRMLLFMMIFPMKAKYFCLLLAGIELYLSLFSPYAFASVGHLLGIAFGYTFARHTSFWTSLFFKPKPKGPHLRLVQGANKGDGDSEKTQSFPKYRQ